MFKARRWLSEEHIQSMQTFLIISLGAILGANARYWLGGWVAERFGTTFPYGTFNYQCDRQLWSWVFSLRWSPNVSWWILAGGYS